MENAETPVQEDNDRFLVRLVTSQAMQFKILFDVLKDLLTEVNFRFDDKGFKIVSLDPGKIGMIHLSIYNLEQYYCEKDVLHIGLFVPYIYRILRAVNTCYHMEWQLHKDRPSVLEIVLCNPEKRLRTVHRVNIMQLDVEEIHIPSVDFQYVISLPSTDFTRHIKELSHVSNTITIEGSDRNLNLIAKGDMGEVVIEVCPTPSGMNWLQKQDNETSFHPSTLSETQAQEPFRATFFLKYLERFTKGQVDPRVEIYLKKDYPIVLRYEMTIGALKFCVAPIKTPLQQTSEDTPDTTPS